jgi:hypothetical protein
MSLHGAKQNQTTTKQARVRAAKLDDDEASESENDSETTGAESELDDDEASESEDESDDEPTWDETDLDDVNES